MQTLTAFFVSFAFTQTTKGKDARINGERNSSRLNSLGNLETKKCFPVYMLNRAKFFPEEKC